MINKDDLKKVINRLTGPQKLEDTDLEQLINNVSVNLITYHLADQFMCMFYRLTRFVVKKTCSFVLLMLCSSHCHVVEYVLCFRVALEYN